MLKVPGGEHGQFVFSWSKQIKYDRYKKKVHPILKIHRNVYFIYTFLLLKLKVDPGLLESTGKNWIQVLAHECFSITSFLAQANWHGSLQHGLAKLASSTTLD
jgi:hypothetical protein